MTGIWHTMRTMKLGSKLQNLTKFLKCFEYCMIKKNIANVKNVNQPLQQQNILQRNINIFRLKVHQESNYTREKLTVEGGTIIYQEMSHPTMTLHKSIIPYCFKSSNN